MLFSLKQFLFVACSRYRWISSTQFKLHVETSKQLPHSSKIFFLYINFYLLCHWQRGEDTGEYGAYRKGRELSHYIYCVYLCRCHFPSRRTSPRWHFFYVFMLARLTKYITQKKGKKPPSSTMQPPTPRNCWVEMGRRRNRVGGGFVPLLYDYHFGNVSNFCWEISFRFFFFVYFSFVAVVVGRCGGVRTMCV